MNIEPIPHWLALLASIIFSFLPLYRGRVRAFWANAVFPLIGFIGVGLSSVRLLIIQGRLVPAAGFQQIRVLLCGFALGLMAALILSGQLLGRKR